MDPGRDELLMDPCVQVVGAWEGEEGVHFLKNSSVRKRDTNISILNGEKRVY
jgi:hypothetical protein